MHESQSVKDLFLIAFIGDGAYAVPVDAVREIVTMPKISPIPESDKCIRGVINLRDLVIPVVDMHLVLGMESSTEEYESILNMMNERESDHRKWLEELELSVKEKRAFNLATDAHQCAFGKWYYAFDANSGIYRSTSLNMILPKFENPHDRIHAIAKKVKEMESSGEFDRAMALIEKTRHTDLAIMIGLFDEAREAISEHSRELAIVVQIDDTKVAMAVDGVESVEHLNQEINEKTSITEVGLEAPIIDRISQRTKDETMVVVLNIDELGSLN